MLGTKSSSTVILRRVSFCSSRIDVKVPLPSVGKNLQDHISAALIYARKEPGKLHEAMRLDRIVRELAKAYLLGTGFANDVPGGIVAFLKTDASAKLPDIQFLFNAGSMAAKPYLPPFLPSYRDYLGAASHS